MLWPFGVGMLLGLVYYLGVQFGPDWPQSVVSWQHWLTRNRIVGQESNLLSRFWNLPATLFAEYVRYSIIGWAEGTYFALATAVLLWRRSFPDRFVIGAAVIAFVVFGMAFASPWHALDAFPMPVLLTAAGLYGGAGWMASGRWSRIAESLTPAALATVCAAPLLAGYLGLTGYYGWVNRGYDYWEYVRDLQRYTPPAAAILGEGSWWFGFVDQPYLWDEEFGMFRWQSVAEADALVETHLRDNNVSTVFLDENLGTDVDPGPYMDIHDVLRNYLDEQCRITGEVARTAYGVDLNGPGVKNTRVYHCGG